MTDEKKSRLPGAATPKSLGSVFWLILKGLPTDEDRIEALNWATDGMCKNCGEFTDHVCLCTNDE